MIFDLCRILSGQKYSYAVIVVLVRLDRLIVHHGTHVQHSFLCFIQYCTTFLVAATLLDDHNGEASFGNTKVDCF